MAILPRMENPMEPSFISINVDVSPDVARAIGGIVSIACIMAIGYFGAKMICHAIDRSLSSPDKA
jgi:hypothetical protein